MRSKILLMKLLRMAGNVFENIIDEAVEDGQKCVRKYH